MGVPEPGFYAELLNTDATAYGGSNVGSLGSVHAELMPWLGRDYSLNLRLPPLAALFLEPRRA